MLKLWSDLLPFIMSIISLVLVFLEWLILGKKKLISRHKEGIINIVCGALSFFPVFLLAHTIFLDIMFNLYEYRLFDFSDSVIVWLLAFIFYDFSSYIVHYLSHRVSILWCFHSVHHQPLEMKASVAFRGSIFDFVIMPHVALWLPILGFHPYQVLIVEGIGLLYGVFLHFNENFLPEIQLSSLQKIFVTPEIHRLHHASNEIYLDKNYGLTFILWDKIFNTLQPRIKSEQIVFGLTKKINNNSIITCQSHEIISLFKKLRTTKGIIKKLALFFIPPGDNIERYFSWNKSHLTKIYKDKQKNNH